MSLLWLPSVWLPTVAVLMTAFGVYGAGTLVDLRAGSGSARPLERIVWGLGCSVLGLFVLAGLDLYRPWILKVLVVSLAAVGFLRFAWEAVRQIRSEPASKLPGAVLVAGVAVLPLGVIYLVTVNPTISWDAAVYHLTLPDLYLREGGFRTIPFLVYGLWPHAVELLFGVAMALESYVAAKALHFAFGLAIMATLFVHAAPRSAAGQRPRREAAALVGGLVAAALFLLNDVVLFELRAAYVDLALAFFVLAAFLLLERWLDDRGPDRLLVAAGLACGLLASTKITGIVMAACLGAMLLPRLATLARLRPRRAFRSVLAFSLPILILWTPWLVRSWIETGNPVYPLLWGVFGGPDWNARLGELFFAWQRSIGMGREPLDYLLLPWRVVTAGGPGYDHFDGRLTPLWLLALPVAAWRAFVGQGSQRTRRALGVSALLFVTWALGSQQMRFLIPVLPLLALAAADGVVAGLSSDAVRRHLRTRARRRALLIAASLAWLALFGFLQTRLVSAGWSHLKLYADPRFERPAEPPSPPVFRAVSELPGDSVVLLLNSNHLFRCRPTTCWANSFFEAPQVDHWLADAADPEEMARRLAARGVTHVAWTGRPRTAPPRTLLLMLSRPDLATLVFAEAADRLWRLETRPGTADADRPSVGPRTQDPGE